MNYTVKRTKRKTLSIKIDPNLTVTIYAPITASQKSIECFVEKHIKWIEKHLKMFNENKLLNQDFYDKKCVYFLGEKREYFANFYKYYKEYSKNYLINRTVFLANELNFNVINVKTKNFKRKWGCCDGKNVVLNEKLIFVDKNLIAHLIFLQYLLVLLVYQCSGRYLKQLRHENHRQAL